MPPTRSQWDFGELFPPEQLRNVISVGDLTGKIRRSLEGQFQLVWVSGEITNVRAQSSGHYYFTLKDQAAQLACVLFRGESGIDRSILQDGRKLLVRGDVTVYEPRGQYQLRVTQIELQGVGALQLAFEKLKQKLNAEGLFSQERKRPIPRYAQRIGLVTSPSGAAIHDVFHVLRRRNPSMEIILVPCRVQGDGAAREIASAINLLNTFHTTSTRLDLILLTRGGGSLEDLWAFNEETVARAVYESSLPVISAVGHEIDFTICDFVADLRGATPSAAAEIISEGVFSSCQFLQGAADRLHTLMRRKLEYYEEKLVVFQTRLGRMHPRRRFNDLLQRLDDLQSTASRCTALSLRNKTLSLRNLADRLGRVRPSAVLRQRREVFDSADQRLHELIKHKLVNMRNGYELLRQKLNLLAPEQVLSRGYSITTIGDDGVVVRSPSQVKPGVIIRTRVEGGSFSSTV